MSSPSTTPPLRNARAEAQQLLGEGHDARVLEPSPPSVAAGPFFADDPVGTSDATGRIVLPAAMPGCALDWDAWLADNPEHADWVAHRWLGGPRHLGHPPSPATLVATRQALHRLAAYVIAPVRHQANGKFGLRWTLGGFGTPFFEPNRQIRVDGTTLVDQVGDAIRAAPITSLRAAAEFLETSIDTETAAEHDTAPAGDVAADLAIEEGAARFLGQWFGMAFAALELVRSDPESVDASRPQIWPGHFDPAIEVGDEDHRASYGASPGDAGIDEPYLYVSVWWPDRLGLDPADPVWNAPSFVGRVLRLSDFPTGRDPVVVAAEFWRAARHDLA